MKIYEFKALGIILNGSDGSLSSHSGDTIELRPQSREVLKLLAGSPNRIVSKEEFTDAVWGGRMVSEDSLVQCIAEIRSAIGDSDRKIIQTVPRKGYRFVPPADAMPKRGPTRTRLATVLIVLFAVLGGLAFQFFRSGDVEEYPAVVAVLPLDDLSSQPHQGFLNDALSEGIITELARFPQFRVVARNSSFQFRDNPEDVREIGDVLGAGYLVEGSQQFDGESVKVSVQLVDTRTGVHLFVDTYERDLDDLFAVQNEIVRQVASVVGQAVLSDMPERTPARDVDSRLRGLQARNIMTQLNRENWERAIALEEASIREEPDSAWGYIGKSLMLVPAAVLGWLEPRDEILEQSVGLARTALRLDPENYMSHYALARVLSRQGKHGESISHFERAAKLNPSDSIVWIGMSVPLLYSGRSEEALQALHRAKEVDPLHGDWLRWQLGLAYWQIDECDRGLNEMQSMASPPSASAKAKAALLVCLDRITEAEEVMSAYLDTRQGFTIEIEDASIPDDWKPDGTRERWLDAMIRAGMPDA
ncbi:MAG: winged helix-turn-helix domain-containing protein [Boseongicola sp.]|nr:winged helix-turn-helix domain-containing protein [Boseongicola sp.]